MAYLALFFGAFLAATLLPFYSEVALVGMILSGFDAWLVWTVATAGNTAGAAVNWVLGRFLIRFKDRRWFPFKGKAVDKAQEVFNRWGQWSLLFAWLPIGGDALTFIAGLMRVPFWIFLILTALGKGGRYAVVIWVTLQAQ